jgi:hypothetical protein
MTNNVYGVLLEIGLPDTSRRSIVSENSSLERVEADLKEVVKDSQGPVDVTGRPRKDGQYPVGCGDSSRD